MANCHICNYENEVDTICSLCAANLDDPLEETKIKEEEPDFAAFAISDKKGPMQTHAAIYLTNKRLILIPAKMKGFGLEGLLEAAIYNKLASTSGVISVPLQDIESIGEGKFGLLVKAIAIDLNDGTNIRLRMPGTLSGRKQWQEEIQKAVDDCKL